MSEVESIYRVIADNSKHKTNRNVNYFVSTDNYSDVSITYEIDRRKYWGLNPAFSEENIKDWILNEKSPLDSPDELNKIYHSKFENKLWNMEGVDEILSGLFFMRTILSFSQHFFFYYHLDNVAENILSRVWENTNLSEDIFNYIDINEKLRVLNFKEKNTNIRRINGRIPIHFLLQLKEEKMRYSLKVDDSTGLKVICIGKNEDLSIESLYKNNELKNYIYCVSSTFYSGVMARVNKIEVNSLNGNSHIRNYMFKLSSITYATHIGFKDPRMSYDTIFFNENEKLRILSADVKENMLQKKLFNSLHSKRENDNFDSNIIDDFNCYLEESIYTHGLNVSGNIITNDNQIIYTKRGKETWDKSVLYCSSNGVCEIDDENVYFYNHSVNCDRPMIGKYGIKNGDFSGELSRESYAELGVEINPSLWKYYGFNIMGFLDEKNKTHSFPLHINILAFSTINQTIEEVCRNTKTAVEREENENVKCIELVSVQRLFYNTIAFLKKLFKELLDISPDILILIVIVNDIIVQFITGDKIELYNLLYNTISTMSVSDKISLVVALFVLIHLINTIILNIKKIKNYHVFRTKLYCLYSKSNKKFIKSINKKFPRAHSIFLLMILLFYNKNQNDSRNK